jgi:hypothetical protein
MADTTSLTVKLFDGARQPIDPNLEVHIQIYNNGNPITKVGDSYKKGQAVLFKDLPFEDNFADDFRIISNAKHHYDAGYVPVKMLKNQGQDLNLMLIPKPYRFDFTHAAWGGLQAKRPELYTFLRAGVTEDAAAESRYVKLMNENPQAMAALLNITTAVGDIRLPRDSGTTALSYFKTLIWDPADPEAPRQDRFYAYADADLLTRVQEGEQQGDWSRELLAGAVHPGATESYKQNQFGEANVQLTFHQQAPAPAGQIKVEADLDYFKEPISHALLEFIPNHFTQGKTNPVMAYALRWIAARAKGLTEFDPLYVIVS